MDKRFNEENKVVIEWNKDKDSGVSSKITGFTKDLSVGGAKIVTYANFPVGTLFMISLSLSRSKQDIKVGAIVRWVKPVVDQNMYEVGLEFTNEFPENLSVLIRHLFGNNISEDTSVDSSETNR
ncbi:PilZ domain-containing protein [Acidobacteriota bacterium]